MILLLLIMNVERRRKKGNIIMQNIFRLQNLSKSGNDFCKLIRNTLNINLNKTIDWSIIHFIPID